MKIPTHRLRLVLTCLLAGSTILIAVTSQVCAEAGVPSRGHRYAGPGGADDLPRARVVDRSGDVTEMVSSIGARAGANYQGEGLTVSATAFGARLRCVFQRLEGEATCDGLWLTSAVSGQVGDRFRVLAAAIGRTESRRAREFPTPSLLSEGVENTANFGAGALPLTGTVEVGDGRVRFIRPSLIEEYSASVDGVRQDFVVLERPAENGDLRVEMVVSGALVEPIAGGAQLVLPQSGRKIAYSRLKATDATGKELPVRMEVMASDAMGADDLRLAVVVKDADAVYPVRIDPTFSDADWISLGVLQGANGAVFAVVTDASGNLYIGGDFTAVGEAIANRVAKWDGSTWSALGSGLDGHVRALAVSGDDVYAGGYFTSAAGNDAKSIAKWDGSTWSALDSGPRGWVYALAVLGNDVYAGGDFTTASGGEHIYVAKWNGSDWSAVGSGMNGLVYALAVSGNDVYAGGYFTAAGVSEANNVAKWNGSAWSALGSGVNEAVYALAVSGNDVYVGGQFTSAGGNEAKCIAKWNGSNWSALGSGLDGYVRALAVSGNDVYVGGQFTSAGGNEAKYIAKWNGNNWSALGSGLDGYVRALAVSGYDLHAVGDFRRASGALANYVAKWRDEAWIVHGFGMDDEVYALAVAGNNLYVGGEFTSFTGIAASHVVKWDGSAWSALGSGVNEAVYALAVSGNDVYAGGVFTTASGAEANYVAKWNGSAWSALGSGVNGAVYALAVSGNDVYAGGDFTTAGGAEANYIAKWNGSAWSALGSGVNVGVYALAVSGNDVYAGGNFWTAGGVEARGIARWNGSAWSALGSGIGNFNFSPVAALSLAVSSGDLYVGGIFPTAGGIASASIAKWNGSTWSGLGSGMDGRVYALAVSGTDLYAGGQFTTAGGIAAKNIAKWNGGAWSALGSGIEVKLARDGPGFGRGGLVGALAASGTNLYAGGGFAMAGNKFSAYLAKAFIAQAGNSLWIQRYAGAGKGYDEPTAIAVDRNGDVIVIGHSAGATGQGDFAMIKYSNAGVPLWTNRYDGPLGPDEPRALALDSSGNVFVLGRSDANFPDECVIIKYSSAGPKVWTYRLSMGSPLWAALAVDGNDNLIVGYGANYSDGSLGPKLIKYSNTGVPLQTNELDLNPINAMKVGGSGNVFVAGNKSVGAPWRDDRWILKYSPSGALEWTSHYSRWPEGGVTPSEIRSIAVDSAGNAVVTGNPLFDDEDIYDPVTIKYSESGVPLWTNLFCLSDDTSNNSVAGLALDRADNVFVTGSSTDDANGRDFVTVKYSASGVPLWTNRFNGAANFDDYATAIAVDSAGNVIVTGFAGQGSETLAFVTLAYSNGGLPLWTNRCGVEMVGGNWPTPLLALDTDGNVFVTGRDARNAGGDWGDFVTTKYSSSVIPMLRYGPAIIRGVHGLRLRLHGSSGQRLRVQRSTNFVDWEDWCHVTCEGNFFELSDDIPTTSQRFYRILDPDQ